MPNLNSAVTEELTPYVTRLSRRALDKAVEANPSLREVLEGAEMKFLQGGDVEVTAKSKQAVEALQSVMRGVESARPPAGVIEAPASVNLGVPPASPGAEAAAEAALPAGRVSGVDDFVAKSGFEGEEASGLSARLRAAEDKKGQSLTPAEMQEAAGMSTGKKLAVGATVLGAGAAGGAAYLKSKKPEEARGAEAPAGVEASAEEPGESDETPGDDSNEKPTDGGDAKPTGGLNLPPTPSNPTGSARKLGDAKTFEEYLSLLPGAEPTGKMEWTKEDEARWEQNKKDLRDVYREAQRRNEWLEVAERIGHALSQFFAAKQGLRTGVDAMSGLKFDKVDWARKQDQLLNDLKMELGLADDAEKTEKQGVTNLRAAHDKWQADFGRALAAKGRLDSASEKQKDQLPRETPETKALREDIKKDKAVWAEEDKHGNTAVSLFAGIHDMTGKQRKQAVYEATKLLGAAGVPAEEISAWKTEADKNGSNWKPGVPYPEEIFAQKASAYLKQRTQERAQSLSDRIAQLNSTMMGGGQAQPGGSGGSKFTTQATDADGIALQFIKQQEAPGGKPALKAYWDHKGYSVGYGHLTPGSKEDAPPADITPKEADRLLAEDFQKHKAIADAALGDVQLPPKSRAAVYSLAYNAPGALDSVLPLIQAGKFDEAAETWRRTYTTASGEQQPGLVDRRAAEADLFLDGIQDASKPKPGTQNLAAKSGPGQTPPPPPGQVKVRSTKTGKEFFLDQAKADEMVRNKRVELVQP